MEKMSFVAGRRTRVKIDPNSRTPQGWVRTRLTNADEVVCQGEQVVVYEPEDRIAGDARVVRIDESLGFIYLDVDWDSIDDDYVQPFDIFIFHHGSQEPQPLSESDARFSQILVQAVQLTHWQRPDPQRADAHSNDARNNRELVHS